MPRFIGCRREWPAEQADPLAESDVRRYVRECLRARSDLRFLDAATAAAAITLADWRR
ncbi:MAG TPA: hypothetical protein VLN49_23835 [Gemmatimonadaceae bacterium]|nr:hypothetical protein [Gemmatimonadaceae bacterium]